MNFGYLKLYIDGSLKDAKSHKRYDIFCPASEEKISEVAWAEELDAELALIAAEKGFKYWSMLSLEDRTTWILKLRDEILKNQELLRNAIMYEMGKTYVETLEDIESLTDSLEWYCDAIKNLKGENLADYENTHSHKMIYQPVGVVVAYLAWNFPLLNIGFKLGPALASGCSIIIKPSELSPVSAYLLGRIMHEINFPPGVVNILSGSPEKIGKTLTKSKIPKAITMIGSTSTGRKIIAESTTSIKRLSLELGGNAPFIVFEDADLKAALDLAIAIKFGNCGQICVAANRFFIHEKVYNKFLNSYILRVKDLKIGFGKEQNPNMGPLINASARDRMVELLEDAVHHGGKIIIGGKVPKEKEKGYWFEPTVLTNLTSKMKLFKQEIFGPIAPFMSFETDDQVLKMANNTDYGLASYIFTQNDKRIAKFSVELEFGEVHVNGVKYAIYLPHGGIKNSGLGHDCSQLALNDYLIKKRVSISN